MTYPSFSVGEVLTASDMNAVGLWLVKTSTIGNAVTTHEVTNAFSSTYDNYLIIISGGSSSATNNALGIQLGSANSGYRFSFNYTDYTNTPVAVGTTTGTSFTYCGSGTQNSLSMYATLQSPYLAEHTFIQSSTSNSSYAGTLSGHKPDTTQYTSFTITSAVGTLTGGTVRVYGYRN